MFRARAAQRSRGKGGGSTPVVENIFSRAVARASADGGRQAKFAVVGHSHVVGAGSSTGTVGLQGAASTSFVAQIAAQLNGLGIPTNCSGLFGDFDAPGLGLQAEYIDPRISRGSGWVSENSAIILGGRFIIQPQGNSGFLEYTPTVPFSSAKYYYPRTSGICNSMDILVDGVVVANISQSGADASMILDLPHAGNKIGFKNIGTGLGFFSAVEFLNAAPTARMISAGQQGASIGSLTNSAFPWSAWAEVSALGPDVGVVYCMTNDINNSVPAATWKPFGKQVIQKFQETGEAILVIDPPGQNFNSTLYGEYQTMAYAIQAETGCAILDLKASFVSYANAVTQGWQYDANHPSYVGHTRIADAFIALP